MKNYSFHVSKKSTRGDGISGVGSGSGSPKQKEDNTAAESPGGSAGNSASASVNASYNGSGAGGGDNHSSSQYQSINSRTTLSKSDIRALYGEERYKQKV